MGGKTSKARKSPEPTHDVVFDRPPLYQPTYREASVKRVAQSLPETPASPRPNIWGELLTANGVYPGSAQFPDRKIEELITAGQLAPRWRPVDEDDPPEGLQVTACPLCFNAYGGPINETSCCTQQVCSECVVFMQTPSKDKPCPFCQRDSFWVDFSGVPLEDAHIIHATTVSAVAAVSAGPSSAASKGVAAASGGSTVPLPSPVVTASVAQRRALEAALEAQHKQDLAADLLRASEDSPTSQPRQHVRSSPLTDSAGDRFALPRAASAAEATGSSRLRAALAAHAAARHRHQDVDRFERYTRGQRHRHRASAPRGPASLAEALSASGGGSPRGMGGGDEDMDVLERMMVMQAMRASLVDSAAPAHGGSQSSESASQPHEETPMHGLLQALGSLIQASHDRTHSQRQQQGQRFESNGRHTRRHSSSSIDD